MLERCCWVCAQYPGILSPSQLLLHFYERKNSSWSFLKNPSQQRQKCMSSFCRQGQWGLGMRGLHSEKSQREWVAGQVPAAAVLAPAAFEGGGTPWALKRHEPWEEEEAGVLCLVSKILLPDHSPFCKDVRDRQQFHFILLSYDRL